MERSPASITQTRAACYFFTFYKPIVKKRKIEPELGSI